MHALRRVFTVFIESGTIYGDKQVHASADDAESKAEQLAGSTASSDSELDESGDSDDGSSGGAGSKVGEMDDSAAADTVVAKLAVWLRTMYAQFIDALMGQRWLSNPSSTTRPVVALRTVIRLMLFDAPATGHSGSFGHVTLRRTVGVLLGLPVLSAELLEVIREGMCNGFADVRFHFLRELSRALGSLGADDSPSAASDASAITARNALDVLLCFSIPSSQSDLLRTAMSNDDGDGDDSHRRSSSALPRALQLPRLRRAFEDAWLALLRAPLPEDVFRKVLLVVPGRVIPHMLHPLMLCDFLTDSYEHGGVVSLLALHGLWVLISEHGLDYPDFYPALYRLLTPASMLAKYRGRFLSLLNLFMASSHLPAYVVAAFIKRVARLALRSPPAVAIFAVPFIFNLVKRHPACMPMLHRDNSDRSGEIAAVGAEAEARDPFIVDEDDMLKCGAMESMLWEVDALLRHYTPSVSSLAGVFKTKLNRVPYTVDDFTTYTYKSLFDSEVKRKSAKRDQHLSVAVPHEMFAPGDVLASVVFDDSVARS